LTSTSAVPTPYAGLAPYLRANIAGTDLMPVAQELLVKAAEIDDDANLWMNLALLMFCLGQRDLGLQMQGLALGISRCYRLPFIGAQPKARLLLLMAPGDLSCNAPLECLLEHSEIEIIQYYLSLDETWSAANFPEHDAIMVGISETVEHQIYLARLQHYLAHADKPVINLPQFIHNTERVRASRLLADIDGVFIPPTRNMTRAALQDVAQQQQALQHYFAEAEFPLIIRPVDSHAGNNLRRIGGCDELAAYLQDVADPAFYVAPFIDYRSQDGRFRKMRVGLIEGQAFPVHMAISSDWMIHYVNAGMYEDSDKQNEEAAFMELFAAFRQRHAALWSALYRVTGLEYLCIDCAELADGRLFIFEIDHTMVVHAMDQEHLFPHKKQVIRQMQDGFEAFVVRLTAGSASSG
jgi:glutathione synthase/RimK-type ligase-like ATP-grasp enzyme